MMHITSALMDELTGQDAFDIVAWNLLRQNARSTGFDGVRCVYRGGAGKRCAIGWLMPDDVYSAAYEGCGVGSLTAQLSGRRRESAFARMLYRLQPLLRALQDVHDSRQPHEWPYCLRWVAERFQLDAAVVDHCVRVFNRVDGQCPSFLTGVDDGREEREAPAEVPSV